MAERHGGLVDAAAAPRPERPRRAGESEKSVAAQPRVVVGMPRGVFSAVRVEVYQTAQRGSDSLFDVPMRSVGVACACSRARGSPRTGTPQRRRPRTTSCAALRTRAFDQIGREVEPSIL